MLFDFARQVLSWLLSDFKISRFELDEFQDREEAGGPIQGSRHTFRPEQDHMVPFCARATRAGIPTDP